MTDPVFLSSNQPAERFYRGGAKIRTFRGTAADGDRVPEDWVGSTTALFGETELGLSRLGTGQRVAEAIDDSPVDWLGADHVERYGADPMLLVKLLDAGQRLPIHLHPERRFASEHLGRRHGKAEAWYILDGGTVHLGFNRDVDGVELRAWVDGQQVESMLDAMHRIDVAPGDSVYVPPGCPHAIGEGVFLAEVQEPEDLSILLEWEGFAIDGPASGHLGLGFDVALQATDTGAMTAADVQGLVVRGGTGTSTLSPSADAYFRAERVDVDGATTVDAGFSILIVLSGAGELQTEAGVLKLSAGETLLVPHAAGPLRIAGEMSFVRCRPPQP